MSTQRDGLWIRELPTAQPAHLVAGTNIESPGFSPSGEWISYVQDDFLYVVPAAGGEPQRVHDSSESHWTPRGDALLVRGDEGVRIFSPTRGWSGLIEGAPLPVAFGPAGNEIVYGDGGDLWRVLMQRPWERKVVLSSSTIGSVYPAAWSGDHIFFSANPDFSASAISDGLELYCVPAEGGPARSLGISALLDADMLAVSTRGILAIAEGDGRETWRNKRIALIDPATLAMSYLTDSKLAAISPSWSPSIDSIAFSAAPEPGSDPLGSPDEEKQALARRRIWLADATGSVPPKPITGDPQYRDEEPMWSADGTHILFFRLDAEDNLTAWLMDAGGSNPLKVADLYATPDSGGDDDTWFGYYGHINWGRMLDWSR